MLNLSGSLQLAVCTTVLLVATACSAILPDRYKKPGVKLNTAGHDYNRCLRQADADGIFTQKRDRRINAMIDKCMEANGYTIVNSK